MLSKEEKHQYRSDLFRHLDGLATAPTAFTLHEHGVLSYLLEQEEIDVSQLAVDFKANEGYLNVALRILCSQGWLEGQNDSTNNSVTYRINNKSRIAFSYVHLYKDVVGLLKFSGQYHRRLFRKEPFEKLAEIFPRYLAKYELTADNELENEVQCQILKHIEGCLTAPSVVALGMSGMFHNYFMEASFRPEEFHKEVDSFKTLLDFFSALDWFKKGNETYSFTDKGLFFARRASAYGVTVSYQNTFRHLNDLIFGDPLILRNVAEGDPEKHVDRTMNVWGSGGAHKAYFKKVDEIIESIFNRPLHEQPKGIVDMGCGNGAYIQHLFEVIEQRTLRGKYLEQHPLFLVGADYNQEALKVTRANLINADIWAKVIWGDIGRPDLLAKDLNDNYKIDLNELLNVRTFLDHNRIWEDVENFKREDLSSSSGAFVSRGRRLDNSEVEANLLEHFKKWSPYVQKFGLLVIELHTVDPKLAAENIGKTAVTAYDATHGFSDQYILELDIFKEVAKKAGMFAVEEYSTKFPNSDLASVSINLFKGR